MSKQKKQAPKKKTVKKKSKVDFRLCNSREILYNKKTKQWRCGNCGVLL